jgi:hypothetical protein
LPLLPPRAATQDRAPFEPLAAVEAPLNWPEPHSAHDFGEFDFVCVVPWSLFAGVISLHDQALILIALIICRVPHGGG